MNVFFDTSSLFKLYQKEEGTDSILKLFETNNIRTIYLAEIALIEFNSVVWRKCKMSEIKQEQAEILISKFEMDTDNFTIIPFNEVIRSRARNLISKHWKSGLRTLDSIQLSSVIKVKNNIDYFVCSDKILNQISRLEGIEVV